MYIARHYRTVNVTEMPASPIEQSTPAIPRNRTCRGYTSASLCQNMALCKLTIQTWTQNGGSKDYGRMLFHPAAHNNNNGDQKKTSLKTQRNSNTHGQYDNDNDSKASLSSSSSLAWLGVGVPNSAPPPTTDMSFPRAPPPTERREFSTLLVPAPVVPTARDAGGGGGGAIP